MDNIQSIEVRGYLYTLTNATLGSIKSSWNIYVFTVLLCKVSYIKKIRLMHKLLEFVTTCTIYISLVKDTYGECKSVKNIHKPVSAW